MSTALTSTFYRVHSPIHGTVLGQTTAGDLAHAAIGIASLSPVALWCPDLARGNAVICGASTGVEMWRLTGLRARQRLIGTTLVSSPDGIALGISPGRFASALPVTDDGVGMFEFGRTEPQGWETFTLQPYTSYTPDPALRAVLDHLATVLTRPITASSLPFPERASSDDMAKPAEGMLSLLARLFRARQSSPAVTRDAPLSVADQHGCFEVLAGLLPHPQWLEASLRLLLEVPGWRPELVTSLRDPWLAKALPDLFAWLSKETRRPPARVAVGADMDVISQAGIGGTPATLGQIAVATARKLVAPRRGCCILATARNEGLYLLEWIAHHRALGTEHFFIYTNDNDDGSDSLLEALSNSGEITWLRNQVGAGISAQNKAYSHGLTMLPDTLDFEWTALIDLDEFIMLDEQRFGSLPAYLRWQSSRPTDAIALNWQMYGSNGEQHWRDAPMTHRFTQPFESMSATIKALARTNLFFHAQPHFPITDVNTGVSFRTADGHRHPYDPNSTATAATAQPSGDTAWVAHYAFKSLDEFLWKSVRNRGDIPVTQGRTFSIRPELAELFVQTHVPPVAGEVRQSALAKAAGLELARLRADPAVKAAFDQVVRHYEAQMPGVREGFRASLAQSADRALLDLLALIPSVGT